MTVPPEIPCRRLLEDEKHRLELKLLGGAGGLDTPINQMRIQKPGLALAGYTEQIQQHRVQVMGETETSYLATLTEENREESIRRMFELGVACFIMAKGVEVDPLFIELADATDTPLMWTGLRTSMLINRIEKLLEAELSPSIHLHGVFVDVMGVGVFIRGPSGVGKSECALDLVMRGHRLVADDVVEIVKYPPFNLIGRGPSLIQYHMEVRGLGILNIQDLFGTMAVRSHKSLDMVADLVAWDDDAHYDRLGLDEQSYQILEVDVPYIKIPVAPGRNIASVVEVAARNYLLKLMGRNSAITMSNRLDNKLKGGK